MQIDLSGRVPLEGDAVDGDGDGVRRVPVDLLRGRRGRKLGLAPRGLEHVLRVVKDLSQIGLFLFLKHFGCTEHFKIAISQSNTHKLDLPSFIIRIHLLFSLL